MSSFEDAARRKISSIYGAQGLNAPSNIEAQIKRLQNDGDDYYKQIESHAQRDASTGGGTYHQPQQDTQVRVPTPTYSSPVQTQPQPTPSPTSDNFGETSNIPNMGLIDMPTVRNDIPNSQTMQSWQTGSQPGDENYTSYDQVLERAAAIRQNRGLDPDPESDAIWAQRVTSGQATLGDARTALTGKARQSNISSQPEPEMPGSTDGGEVDWAFDPVYNEGMNRLDEMEAQIRSQEELIRRRATEDTNLALDEVKRAREDALKANTERMADGGLVHSGINVQAQADVGEEYMRVVDQIERASARGEEDVARMISGQYAELQRARTELETARAEKQAALEEKRAMEDAINAVPTPTASGRYDLSYIQPNARAVGQASGADAAHMATGNDLAARIEQIFLNRDVPMVTEGETDAGRIARLTQEVAEGYIDENGQRKFRTMDDIRNSVDWIARRMNL